MSAVSETVREALRFEFAERTEKNERYSLRAFARDLGVSHTLLSLVMNGHRSPSQAFIDRISERVGVKKLRRTRRPQELSLDQFALISEWQHYAILSLLEVADTKLEPRYLAQRLGISIVLAKMSIQRLIDLKIIEQDADGRWRQRSGPMLVNNSKSTEHTRKFQRQLLQKAGQSLDFDSPDLRDFSSTTFAMNPRHVSYALERIRAFRRQLSTELESFGEPEEVYNLTVQIFPTTRRRKS